jgi:hypothetical protein
MTCRRKFFHRIIFIRVLAIRVTDIRRVPLFQWPWERSSSGTIWVPGNLQRFKELPHERTHNH